MGTRGGWGNLIQDGMGPLHELLWKLPYCVFVIAPRQSTTLISIFSGEPCVRENLRAKKLRVQVRQSIKIAD